MEFQGIAHLQKHHVKYLFNLFGNNSLVGIFFHLWNIPWNDFVTYDIFREELLEAKENIIRGATIGWLMIRVIGWCVGVANWLINLKNLKMLPFPMIFLVISILRFGSVGLIFSNTGGACQGGQTSGCFLWICTINASKMWICARNWICSKYCKFSSIYILKQANHNWASEYDNGA